MAVGVNAAIAINRRVFEKFMLGAVEEILIVSSYKTPQSPAGFAAE